MDGRMGVDEGNVMDVEIMVMENCIPTVHIYTYK